MGKQPKNRAEKILNLVDSDRNFYDDEAQSEMLDWLGDRDDKELIELIRGSFATLAYRSVTTTRQPVISPSSEVYMAALKELADRFNDSVQRQEND